MKSKVWFVDARSREEKDNIVEKIKRIWQASELNKIIEDEDLVALKANIGQPGNIGHIRPIYYRTIVDLIKESGGYPYVAETVGLGSRGRKDSKWKRSLAPIYLDDALKNGINQSTIGAPIIIADGIFGLDEIQIKIEGNKLKETYIARGIANSDVLICLTHAKGHGTSGYAGALKNLGAGCASKRARYLMHHGKGGELYIDNKRCNKCNVCIDKCLLNAISIGKDGFPVINEDECAGCLYCLQFCKPFCIRAKKNNNPKLMQRYMIDNALGVVKCINKDKMGFITVMMDITPNCDCPAYSDTPIVQDIGLLVSFDPVAIDKAAIDLINQASGLNGSVAEEFSVLEPNSDKFVKIHSKENRHTDWRFQIKAAEELGLGSSKYSLLNIEA